MKSLLSALKRSASKGSKQSPTGDGYAYPDENDASPLAPRRLLSATPEGSVPVGRQHLRSCNVPTPKVLPGDKQTPVPRVQREPSLRFNTVQKTAGPTRQQHAAGEGTPSVCSFRFSQDPQATSLQPKFDASTSHDAGGQQPGGGDNIKVIVRVRPANDREHSIGGSVCVQPLSATSLRVSSMPEPHSFTFDHVAQQDASQESIFRATGRHIVENCLQGFNGCIFTYGQTGSGKTFTMLGGSESADSLDESRGLIQRVFEHLFMRIREKQEQVKDGESCKYMLRCSFLEIYNETITDLLNPAATNLAIREDIRKGVYVEGLLEEECRSVEDVIQLLQQGIASRRVGETNMNDKSSRSHCVFTCTLESKTSDAAGTTNILFSRLHLVDLAGSERQKASGAQGERLREASSINKSLSTLGHVISSLVDLQSGKSRHVPYRDSRLTFLLQDSLGGNAKACLVATISPAIVNMAETLSTLRFADNTKRIKNKAVVNEDTNGETAALRKEIKRLRDELARAKEGLQQQPAGGDLPWAEGFGSPMRLSVMRTISSSPLHSSPGGHDQQGTRRALLAALRREEAAVRQAARQEAELHELVELVKLKDADLQRTNMIAKLKDARLARLQGGMDTADARVVELQQEIELLRSKIDSHPEVRRFAVENLHLGQEVERLRELLDRNELRCLQDDIGGLRGEMLAMADALERAQEEAVVQQALAQSLKVESDMAADHIRSQVTADKDMEVAQLQSLLQQEQEQLYVANAARVQLQQQVSSLQAALYQLESTAQSLRAEMSPVRRQASQFEQQLEQVREESSAAQQRASSEVMLHSQQLEQQVRQVEAECAQLRLRNEQLERAKAGEEQESATQLDSLEQECGSLKAQVEQERAVAAERQGDYNDALQQLDSLRKRISSLELECSGLQGELHEAREALAQQRDEHEAAQSAAAESIAAALAGAREMQGVLEAREAQVQELQQEAESLRQQHRQLEQQKKHIECQLAQRDNELQELGQSVEDLELAAAKHKEELAQATDEVERLRGDLAGREQSAAEAAQRVQDLTAQLEAAAHQLPEKESQLLLARAEANELRQGLAANEEALLTSQAQLSAKDSELAAMRSEMASEVAAAAQQVQQLLAAQQEAESLRAQLSAAQQEQQQATEGLAEEQQATQQELAALRGRLAQGEAALAHLESHRHAEAEQARAVARRELEEATAQAQALQQQLDASQAQLAEAQAGAVARMQAEQQLLQQLAAMEEEMQQLRDDLKASSAGAQPGAQAQLEELVVEREGWIEEMHQHRVAARAAADAAVALERKLVEVSEARRQLQADLAASREREAKLEEEVTGLTGQHNIQQRIQYHKKVKDENNMLKEELSKMRIDLNIVSVRWDRAKAELARFRSAAGQEPLPDWDEEERLRQSLAVVQAENIKLQRDYEEMASAIVHMARRSSVGPGSLPPSPGGEDSDIVLEFVEPASAHLGAAARHALEEIQNRQRDAQRSMADMEHQIRLLKESSKLQRIRRTSGW